MTQCIQTAVCGPSGGGATRRWSLAAAIPPAPSSGRRRKLDPTADVSGLNSEARQALRVWLPGLPPSCPSIVIVLSGSFQERRNGYTIDPIDGAVDVIFLYVYTFGLLDKDCSKLWCLNEQMTHIFCVI